MHVPLLGMTITRHASDPEAVVFQFLTRNYKAPDQMVARFNGSCLELASDLTPEAETSNTAKAASRRAPRWDESFDEALTLCLSEAWLAGELKRELRKRFSRLSEGHQRDLYREIRDHASVFTAKGPHRGQSPTHLIGNEAEVVAMKKRLEAEDLDRRQGRLAVEDQ